MQKVQLSSGILAKLDSLRFTAELCDESGNAKAVVLPLEIYHELFSIWTNNNFDEEQLRRARIEAGGYSTREAIAFLHKMVTDRGSR
jgi:hypothetical protein